MTLPAFLRRMTLIKFFLLVVCIFASASLVIVGAAVWPQGMAAFVIAAVILVSVGTVALEIRFPDAPDVNDHSSPDHADGAAGTPVSESRRENWLSGTGTRPRAPPMERRRIDHAAELEHEVERLRQIADASRSGIAQVDGAGTCRYANTRMLDIFGAASVAELTSGEAVFEVDGETYNGLPALLRLLAARPEQEVEIHFHAAGASRILRGHASRMKLSDDLGDDGTVFHVTDVTESVHQDFRDRYYAKHDGLTGAYNRVAFMQDLDEAANRSQCGHPFALFAIDLDRFKPINDTHGHAAGDAVLKTVVSRLGASVGAGASVYRLGGDEFMVIAPVASAQDASATASEILSGLEQPITLSDSDADAEVPVSVTASLGIAMMPQDASSVRDLVNLADRALYRSKEAGGGHVHVHAGAANP